MRNSPIFLLLLTLPLFLASCAEQPPSHSSVGNPGCPSERTFNSSYETAWGVLLSTLSRGHSILSQDKTSGEIRTMVQEIDNSLLEPLNISTFARTYRHSYAISLDRISVDQTKIVVQPRIELEQFGQTTKDVDAPELQASLRAILFKQFCQDLYDLQRQACDRVCDPGFISPPITSSSLWAPGVADITWAQKLLASLGFKPGRPDGVLGPRTRAALKRYQKTRNLPATGDLDRPTFTALTRERAGITTEKQTKTSIRISGIQGKALQGQGRRQATVAEMTEVKSKPTPGSEVLMILDEGTPIQVVERQDVWSKIEINGKVGYILSKVIRLP